MSPAHHTRPIFVQQEQIRDSTLEDWEKRQEQLQRDADKQALRDLRERAERLRKVALYAGPVLHWHPLEDGDLADDLQPAQEAVKDA